jgi:hypothetical protein
MRLKIQIERILEISRITNKMSKFYGPALMTKNFERQMPLFLNEKNVSDLSKLFKNFNFPNKYSKSVADTKKFRRLKVINQQKTKTQDRLGELTDQADAKSFLEKNVSEVFKNALNNFWFKDADKFLRDKKSIHLKKDFMWDVNEPTVYDRMQKDVKMRSVSIKAKIK